MDDKARSKDNIRRMKANRARIARECAQKGRMPDGFTHRETEYARQFPHLLSHSHCGLDLTAGDAPRRRVVCPNGVVLYTSWYKVPTTDADAKLAAKEAAWLLNSYPRAMLEAERRADAAFALAEAEAAQLAAAWNESAARLAA